MSLAMVTWIGEIALSWAVLFAIQVPLRRKPRPVARTVAYCVKLVLIPLVALLFVAVDSVATYTCGGLLGAVYIALIGDALSSPIEYAARRIRSATRAGGEGSACMQGVVAVLSLLTCVAVAAYGVWNATTVNQRVHEWETEGLAREHTFAFLADMHAGSAQSLEVLQDLCAQINEAKPEFVILGGDVTDELTSFEDMNRTYEIISEIDAPVYFVYGNHDRQPNSDCVGGRTYSDGQLETALANAGVHVLSDEFVRVADDLVLLGREDISAGAARSLWTELDNPYEGKGALVVVDHQPYDSAQLADEKSALQLSGHTHAGQLWPLQAVYSALGLPAYGEFRYLGTLLYVSAGESGWMAPLRTERHCEWDLITLKP